ncbi:uncharacterized protein LOC117327116 isoform X1 [Pecten maximus]|uniref:uncharacterized protein LOC117327116 isoform X1 n=1 Tax=Pecten maximus TaxID=6579 RepID=UPI001458974B|nr:uncharacterized protein LOC117327116 isoform X1 [Pecten maximus]
MQEKMETQNIKLTFIGNPRAGKTCLMQQLLRKHIKPGGPEPTYVAELLIKRIRYKLGKSAKEREEIKKGKEAELCRKHMRRLQKRNADEGELWTMAESNTDLYDNSGHHKDHDCIEESTGGERHTHHMTKPHTILYDRDMYPLTEDQRKDLEDIDTEDGGIDDPSTAYVTLFDFGGEEEFYHWHHCIMSANSIYLLVVDVSLWQDTEKQDKIVDKIVDWLKSVATYAKTESDKEKGIPPIILVGSHMDEVEMNEDQVFEEISKKLDKKPEIKDILEHNVQEYFFIMHMDKTDKNTEEIYLDIWCQIEKCAHLQSCWHEKIAGSWLALERRIMMEKEKGIKFLTTQQILKINEDLLVPIKESELVPFLRYLHNAASIFCFDIVGKTDSEILTEREMQQMKVILDINWIVRAFGDIITDSKFVNLKSFKDRQTSKQYKGSAKLTNEVLKLCWGNITKEDCHVLLSVMESLGLITKPRNVQDSQKKQLEPNLHIVPCLLDEASPESVQGILNNASVELTQTLCLIFLNQFVPQTIWDKIIAICMHKFSECTYHKTSEEGYLCPRRGFVCRNVDDFWNFVLHCKGQMLKLTMFNDHRKPVTQGVGEALRSEIESIVNHVLSKTNREHRIFRHYLHCDFWISDGENENRKPNAKIFMENYEYRSFDRDGNEFMLTQDHWQIWFGEVNKISDMEKFRDMTKVKEIHAEMVLQLSKLICPGLKTQWDNFLTLLKPYLGDDVLYGVEDNSVSKLCDCLKSKGWIKYGEYTVLRNIVNRIDVDAAGVIDKALTKLKPLRMLPK